MFLQLVKAEVEVGFGIMPRLRIVTNSSTSVRLRAERGRLSPLSLPNGVFVGIIVPIYRKGIKEKGIVKRDESVLQSVGKALDAASFA